MKLLQYVAVLGIVLFMTTQPLAELFLHLTDSKYELCELYDEEESKEEKSKDKQEKIKEYKYCASNHLEAHSFLSMEMTLSKVDLHHNQLSYIMEHYMVVLSPPPELT